MQHVATAKATPDLSFVEGGSGDETNDGINSTVTTHILIGQSVEF